MGLQHANIPDMGAKFNYQELYDLLQDEVYKARMGREKIYQHLDLEVELAGGPSALEKTLKVQPWDSKDLSKLTQREQVAEIERISEEHQRLLMGNLELLKEINQPQTTKIHQNSR